MTLHSWASPWPAAFTSEQPVDLGESTGTLGALLSALVCARALRRYAARRRMRRTAALILPVTRTGTPHIGGRVGRRISRRAVVTVAAASLGLLLFEGLLGVGVAAAAGWAAWKWAPVAPPDARAVEEAEAARQLPLVADLLSACLAAGAGPVAAARAVGQALEGPVGGRLCAAAAQVQLGGGREAAWHGLAELPGAAPLARCLERAAESGAPVAEAVARAAAEARAEQGRTATARARRAAVLVTAPVGLCFLPSFLVLGVVPVLIGMAGRLKEGAG